jgi:hypothetical protein
MRVSNWFPSQVVEPFGIEFHLSRRIENDILVSTSMSLDIDSIDTRLSYHDIILLHSVVSQRALVMRAKSRKSSKLSRSKSSLRVDVENQGVSSPEKDADISEKTQVTTYSLSFSMGLLKMVLINDFNRQNLPVFQIRSDSTLVNIDGVPQLLEGIGKLSYCIDFYNPLVCRWEPVVETWTPELKFASISTGVVLTLSTSDRLQMSVTGIMLDRLLQTYSVALHSHNEFSQEIRSGMLDDLMIKNMLVEDIDVYETVSDSILFRLGPDESRPFDNSRTIDARRRKASIGSIRDPFQTSSVHIYFTGDLGKQR